MNVAPREGRVSRNVHIRREVVCAFVAPREGRVSRNLIELYQVHCPKSRAPRGACE